MTNAGGNRSGRLLTDLRGVSFWFDGGALCVDFAHTGAPGKWAVFESLHRPSDLAAWLAEPPLGLPRTLSISESELATARHVRNALWTALDARAHGREVPATARRTINQAAAQPPLAPQLGRGGTQRWQRPVTVAQALSTMARELVELLASPLGERVRQCGGDNCALVFVDTSRPGSRRWCAMERCGNRHKLRAHRARRHDQG
jgi:predicted RNA-binding Zn ribbon-like protein